MAALIVALVVAASASGDGPTTPQGGGANNVVLVQQFTDGASLARAETQVSSVGGPTVASSNIAAALSSGCTGCHATAVAVQVVFVTGAPQYFLPGNSASAVNSGCTGCGSFAYAWQYVVQTDGPVYLTPGARVQIAALRTEIAETAASIVPASLDDDLALKAKLNDLTAQLKDIADTQTKLAGVPARGTVYEEVEQIPSD